MRSLTILCSLFFVFSGNAARVAATTTFTVEDRVVIEKKKVVLVRKGRLARQFPDRKTATVSYPVVKSGLKNPAVLKRVRSLLQIKNIFDTSLAEYRADAWLDEFDYQVNYNKNFILDITFTQSGQAAYPDSQTKNFAINLKTGTLIKARDVFKPATLRTLAEMIDRKLQAEKNQIFKEAVQRGDITTDEKKNIQEMFDALKFQVKDLDNFSVSDKGITFLYDAGFPHVVQALEPEGKYFLSYAELRSVIKPEGLLGRFIS
jgi:hypothetical protein